MSRRLQASGHRVTPQREAVMRVLATSTSHPSADDVYAAVQVEQPGIGLATIYNTLDLLRDLGEIVALDFGEGFRRFDGRDAERHGHVICTVCGRVDDVDRRVWGEVPAAVATHLGYRVSDCRVDLWGLCPVCQATSQVEPAEAHVPAPRRM